MPPPPLPATRHRAILRALPAPELATSRDAHLGSTPWRSLVQLQPQERRGAQRLVRRGPPAPTAARAASSCARRSRRRAQPTVTRSAANLRPAPPLDGPYGAGAGRRGAGGRARDAAARTISAPPAAASSTAAPIALRLPRALTLAGVGSKTGGTVLSGFSVVVGEEVDGGGLLELVGFHVSGGAVDVSPMELSRVRLSDVSVTAPAGTMAALYIDEIGTQLLGRAEEEERVLLDGCWVRGGVNGVVVNAVGCTLRHCRAQGAAQYGVHANASVALEACTVGGCGKAGVLARAGLTELRSAGGINENRIQRDAWDKSYNGFSATSNANACACTSFFQFAQAYSMMQGGGIGKVTCAPAGQGRWTNTADYLPQKS